MLIPPTHPATLEQNAPVCRSAERRTTRLVFCVLEERRLRLLGCATAESRGWLKGKIADQRAVAESILAALRQAAASWSWGTCAR